MAGDWIKVREDLPDDPKVLTLARILSIDPERAVGLLIRFWTWAQKHTADGKLASGQCPASVQKASTLRADIDRVVRETHFAEALENVGWLTVEDGLATIPHFDRHMSKSAKERALDALRKRAARAAEASGKRPGRVRKVSGKEPDQRRERGEKSVGEVSPTTPLSERDDRVRPTKSQCMALYDLYPRKADKGKALPAIDRAIRRIGSTDGHPGKDDPIAWLQARVVAFAKSPLGQPPLNGGNDYRSYPTSWFNGERYDDDDSEWQRPNGDLRNGQGARSVADIRRERERADQYPIDTTPPRELV